MCSGDGPSKGKGMIATHPSLSSNAFRHAFVRAQKNNGTDHVVDHGNGRSRVSAPLARGTLFALAINDALESRPTLLLLQHTITPLTFVILA